MNDYKNRFKHMDCNKKTIQTKKMTIRGVEISNIQKEDVLDFCEIKGVSPEYLVLKLIENID